MDLGTHGIDGAVDMMLSATVLMVLAADIVHSVDMVEGLTLLDTEVIVHSILLDMEDLALMDTADLAIAFMIHTIAFTEEVTEIRMCITTEVM